MSNKGIHRIILVDDHIKVHQALSLLIDNLDEFELVAQGSNGEEAIQLCAQHQPDIVLMDVMMPVMDGIKATKIIHSRFPEIKILALSSFQDEDSIRAIMEAGAVGYLVKSPSIEGLADTLRTTITGRTVLSQEAIQVLLQSPEDKENANASKIYGLTPRETEVLSLLVKGSTNKQIAYELNISISTAKFHVSIILNKLNVSSRVEAVALAVEENLV